MKIEVKNGHTAQTLEIIISEPAQEADFALIATEVYVGVKKLVQQEKGIDAVGLFREDKLYLPSSTGIINGGSVVYVMFAVNSYVGNGTYYTAEQLNGKFNAAFDFMRQELEKALKKFFAENNDYFNRFVKLQKAGASWSEIKELFYEFRSAVGLPSRSKPCYEKYGNIRISDR